MPYLLLIDPTDAVAHAASVELEAVTPVSFIESARGASDSGHAGRPRRPFSVALESAGRRDDLQESAEDSGWLAYQAMRAEFLLPTDLDHLRARMASNQPAPPTAPPGNADDDERPPVPGIRLRLRVPAFNRAVEGRSGDLLLALATVTFTLERAGYWSAVAQGLWPAQQPTDPPRERFADYAATGSLDKEGRVGAVGGAAVKVDAAINKLPPGGLVFYPRANESEISAEQLEAADSRGVTLHAVERWEDAAQLLGVRLERYWPGNPWLGLSAYQPHHRKIYFCRDAELADAIDKLRRRAERGTPGLLILAASGVGKSSFARCGMVAEVKAMLGPKMLAYVIWTPGQAVRGDTAGRDDVRALATSIHAQLADVPALSDLRGDAPPDFAALEASLSPLLTPARPLLFVVDQLEELFAADFAADAVTAFCEFVVQLQGLGVWVLATLPDAFFGAYKQQPALLRAFGDEGQFNLPAVSKEALRQAIVEPARRARLRFARDERARTTLADRIHADVQGEIDALPLLSFVLNRLYLNHDRVQGLLTWRAYEEEGGLSGAIGREAERAFAALPPAAQDELPRLLRALVRAGAENGAYASVPVVLTEADWPEHGAGRTLVRALVKERLLVEEGRAAAGGANAQVRIAHRALLSNWERAAKLLSENREVMLTRDRLEQRAREWVGDPAAHDELLSSQRDLAAARELREELGAELDTAQYRRLAAFIAASLAAQAQREQAAEAAQQRERRRDQQELDRERRAKTRLRFWARIAVAAAVLAAAAAGVASWKWFEARDLALKESAARLEESVARKEAQESDAKAKAAAEKEREARTKAELSEARAKESEAQALTAADEATRQRDAAERAANAERSALITATLRRALSDSAGMLRGAPGGDVNAIRLMLVAHRMQRDDVGGTAAMLSALSGPEAPRWTKAIETPQIVTTLAVSPDGRRILSVALDGTMHLRDTVTGESLGRPWPGHSGGTNSVAFSPDGLRVASGGADKAVRLWDAVTGAQVAQPLVGHEYAVGRVAFSPDGKYLVSVDGATFRQWDVASQGAIGEPLIAPGVRRSFAFSPDRRLVLFGGLNNDAVLWDFSGDAPIIRWLTGHKNEVTSASFSPDGRLIVTGSLDRTLRLWDAASGAQIGLPLEADGFVSSVAFGPDGRRVASATADGALRLWDPDKGAQIGAPMRGHNGVISIVVFTPDGRGLVSGSADKSLRIWDATSAPPFAMPLKGHLDAVRGVSFSPDSRRLVSGSYDGTLRRWDVTAGSGIGAPIRAYANNVMGVAFSREGNRVASVGGGEKSVSLWDIDSGALIGLPRAGHESGVNTVAVSSDGQHIVSGGADKNLRLWDASSGAPIGLPMPGHADGVMSVAFSPDSRRIASGSEDGTVRLWDVGGRRPLGSPLRAKAETPFGLGFTQVFAVAFSPDGRRVVSAGPGSAIRLWDAANGTQVGEAPLGLLSPALSVAFSPDGRFIASGGADKTLQLWSAATLQPIGTPLQGHGDFVLNVAWSPDGRRIASGDRAGTLLLWPAPAAWPDLLCSKLTRNFSKKEWDRYIGPELPYVEQCPGLPVPRD